MLHFCVCGQARVCFTSVYGSKWLSEKQPFGQKDYDYKHSGYIFKLQGFKRNGFELEISSRRVKVKFRCSDEGEG